MPIYEYECSNCKTRFELLRSIDDKDADVKCPHCGKPFPKRILTTFTMGTLRRNCAPRAST